MGENAHYLVTLRTTQITEQRIVVVVLSFKFISETATGISAEKISLSLKSKNLAYPNRQPEFYCCFWNLAKTVSNFFQSF
jgi:hypothetical protein